MPEPAVDVAVVGAGVVGSALALALADDGWHVAVLERAPPPLPAALPAMNAGTLGFDLRTSALSPGSRRLLQHLGVPDDALGHVYRGMHVEAPDDAEFLDFEAADGLGSIAGNGALAAALWERLAGHERVRIECPATVAGLLPGGGVLTDDGRELAATLVVGADGGRSQVRELAGADSRALDPDQHALVTVVGTERGATDVAWQRFMDNGTLAFLPLGTAADGRPRFSIVWSAPPEMVAALQAAPEAVFAERLKAASVATFGVIGPVDRRVSFPLAQRFVAAHVPAAGVVLVGDAAHVVHPLAGQGANMGLRDVDTLVAVLRLARQAGCSPADPGFLREYSRRRAADNLAMLAGIAAMPRVWTAGGLMRWLRAAGLAWLRGSDAGRRRLTVQATR